MKRAAEREASNPENAGETVTAPREGGRKEKAVETRKAGGNNNTRKPGEGAGINTTKEAEEEKGEENDEERDARILTKNPIRGRSTSEDDEEDEEITQHSQTHEDGEDSTTRKGKRPCNRPLRYQT